MASASLPADATLLPPSYTPQQQSQPPTHSISDLHNQITANAILLYKRRGLHEYEEAKPLVAVAKTTPKQQDPRPAGTEKKGLGGQGSAFAANEPSAEKYYALLVHASPYADKFDILLCGEKRDTVLEALEDVLEQTARKVHEKVAKHV